MIAAAKALGADPAAYAEPSHGIQRRNLANLALVAGIPEPAIRVGVDGCAVPSFAVPLRAAARALARYTTPDDLPPAKAAAAGRVTAAMLAHPELVAGDGRFDTEVMRAARGRVLAKSGAEGVMVVGVPGARTGIAVKIADGAERALHALVAELLVEMGLVAAGDVERHRARDVRTREGVPVGEVQVRL
jgi:L-asparaginase II